MKGGSSSSSSRKRTEKQPQQEEPPSSTQPPPIEAEEDRMYDVEEEENPAEEEDEAEAEAEEEEDNHQEEEEEERPKLAEGFFEIEAVRGKRTRKGKRQYLIKWRNWPETANTWEPFDNLQSCSDIIQAFEQRSAKTSRKRKRKHTTTTSASTSQTQPPKRKQLLPDSDSIYTTTAQPNRNHTLSNLAHPPHHGVETGRPADTTDYMLLLDNNHNPVVGNDVGTHYFLADNSFTNIDNPVNQQTNEAEPDIPMLTAPPTVLDNGNISIQVPDTEASQKDDQSKAEISARFIGAKRRKSGRVRRFKPDALPAALDQTRPSIPEITNAPTSLALEPLANGAREVDCLENPSAIIKIIEPISYSTTISDDAHDVSLVFRAMRSDGGQTEVDNNYLKVHNPLLLISYYEQYLRYTPPT